MDIEAHGNRHQVGLETHLEEQAYELERISLRKKSVLPSAHPSRQIRRGADNSKDASVQVDEAELSKGVGGKFWEAMQTDLAAVDPKRQTALKKRQEFLSDLDVLHGDRYASTSSLLSRDLLSLNTKTLTRKSDVSLRHRNTLVGISEEKHPPENQLTHDEVLALSRLRTKIAGTLTQAKFSKKKSFFKSIASQFLMYGSIQKIEGKMGSNVAQYFIFLRWVLVLDLVICILYLGLLIIPQSLHPLPRDVHLEFLDALLGSGVLLDTPMFYSGYQSRLGGPVSNSHYQTDLAYIGTLYGSMLLSFLTAVLCLREFIKKGDQFTLIVCDDLYKVSIPLLTSWDFTITSKQGIKSMNNGTLQLLLEVRNNEYDMQGFHKRGKSRASIFMRCYVIPALFWSLTFVFYAASSYGFYRLVKLSVETGNFYLSSFSSVIITVSNIVVPLMYYFITEYEYAHKSYDFIIKVTTIRNFFWRIVTLVATLFSIYLVESDCWQASFGQALYQLLLADILSQCIYYTVGLLITAKINCWWYAKKEMVIPFDIPYNLNGALYTQTLIWLGILYAPANAVIGFFGTLLVFACRVWGWMRVGTTPNRFSSWNSHGFCLIMFILTLVFNSFAIGYFSTLEVKSTCGPFVDESSMHHVITSTALRFPGIISNFLNYMCNVGFHGSLSIAFIGVSSCMWILRSNLKKKNQNLVGTIVTQRGIINKLFHSVE